MSSAASEKRVKRTRRKAGIRKTLLGTPSRPRLTVFRSLSHIYAQVIDDLSGHTLASASTRDKGFVSSGNKSAEASTIGTLIAERAKAKGVAAVVFDRNGFSFHGRVKAVAESARAGGLSF